MMARQALLRPIEITSSNNTFTVGASTKTITEGVYPNIYGVLYALSVQFTPITFVMARPWRVSIVGTAGVPEITRTALSDLLGFVDTNDSSGNTLIAKYAPAYCWASEHQHNTPERWTTDARGEFVGAMTADGNLHGLTMTTRETLKITWPWEPAVSAFPSAAKVAENDYATSASLKPEQASCFWSVATGARSSYPVASTSENVATKGVYYIADLDAKVDTSDLWFSVYALALPWDSGGTNFDNENEPVFYCFCSVAEPPPAPKSQRNLATYYDVDVTLTTAVAPAWKVGIYTP